MENEINLPLTSALFCLAEAERLQAMGLGPNDIADYYSPDYDLVRITGAD